MDSFSIRNFGCRVNQAESFEWAEDFQKRGLRLDPEPGCGELVIVNTCTLTGRADRDVRKFIRKVIRDNPTAKVVVTGCLAERNPREFSGVPGIWKIIANGDKKFLAERLLPGRKCVADREARPYRARALLKVQDGCNMACSFCVIPGVRGRSVSVPEAEVLGRIESLARRGYKEIVLTGIHLCSYGGDWEPRSSLLDLLRGVEGRAGDFKVRLSSLDPRLLPGPLINRLAASGRIQPHFHLSLQHGSEKVLKAMGRSGTISAYRDIMDHLRMSAPRAALGADVIVGFPGETDDDFRATEKFLGESPLAYFHVFSFSPRPGTPAAAMKPVDEKTKNGRAARLRKLSQRKNAAFRARFSSEILDGVVIERTVRGADVLTANYISVAVPDCSARKGDAVKVKIIRVTDKTTEGKVV
ncbi:MAG: tRNA (N(6)-L-threonylcarbamoyladenosine(37)-C(2))-methylthiotransferase MtaB [Candidatus Aminicenantales bacterium]